MLVAIFVLLTIPAVLIFFGLLVSAPKYQGPVSDHFDGKKFINPGGVKASGLRQVLKWMLERKQTPWPVIDAPESAPRPLAHNKEGIRLTFINHTTFLIQVDGINILTDPVWSQRTSPFTWIGPKRKRPPGVKLEDLPRIDLILLSHNHYDHLDMQTMRILTGAHHPKIVTSLGVKRFLDDNHIAGSFEIDWWQEWRFNEQIKITGVPAQHFSGRGMLDRDATLWCGYIISTTAGNIYFAGDTGYNEKTFKEIGERFQPVRMSLIPIGAYKPEWFMSPIHVSPFQAVKIHMDVRSQKSIASHWGTFQLADEGYDEPGRDLRKALNQENISEDSFIVVREGEPFILEYFSGS